MITRQNIKNIIKDYRFWVLLFFIIRLYGITNPPLEIGHNWRQITGLMVARNYLEVDANIFHPRIDDNRGETGIIGMEFPAMNYLYYIIAKIFGYTHWYGRLINLIISSIALLFFYKLVKKYLGNRHALFSTICLIGSCWFAYSRKMMPDTFCISLMLIGIYYGTEYLENGKKCNIFLYLFLVSIAILSKIPAGIYLAVFVPLLIYQKNLTRKLIFCSVTIIPLALTFIWYFIWNPYVSLTYGNLYNSGRNLSDGFRDIISYPGQVLEKFYFISFNSFILFGLFIIGLFLIFFKHKKMIIYPFIAVGFVFLIYMFKCGYYFYHHNYYIVPFVPVMALVAGYAISLIKNKYVLISILSIGLIESIANQQNDFFIKDSEKYKLDLEAIADNISTKHDLIVINGGPNPQQIYLAHRKGWTCNDEQLTDSIYLNDISKRGCNYIFVNKHSFSGSIKKNIVFDNDDFTVYKL